MYVVGSRGGVATDRIADVLGIDQEPKVRRAGILPQPLSDAAAVSLPGRLIVADGDARAGAQTSDGEYVPTS